MNQLNMSRRGFLRNAGLTIGVVSLGTVALSSCGGEGEAKTEGKSATIAWGTYPFGLGSCAGLVGMESGAWSDAGTELSIQPFNSAADAVNYLISGKAQLAEAGIASTLGLVAGGASALRLVGTSFAPLSIDVIVAADSSISSVDDVAGEKFALLPAGLTNYMVGEFLKGGGMTAKDIDSVSVASIPAMQTAVEQGVVQVGLSVPPLSTQSIVAGKIKSIWNSDTALPDLAGGGIWTTQDVLDETPEIVENFLKGLVEASRQIKADPEKAARLYAEANELEIDVVRAALDPVIDGWTIEITEAQFEANVTANRTIGSPGGDLKFDDVVRPEIAQKVMRSV